MRKDRIIYHLHRQALSKHNDEFGNSSLEESYFLSDQNYSSLNVPFPTEKPREHPQRITTLSIDWRNNIFSFPVRRNPIIFHCRKVIHFWKIVVVAIFASVLCKSFEQYVPLWLKNSQRFLVQDRISCTKKFLPTTCNIISLLSFLFALHLSST